MPSRRMEHQHQMHMIGHDDIAVDRHRFVSRLHVENGLLHLCADGCQVCFREGAEALPYDV